MHAYWALLCADSGHAHRFMQLRDRTAPLRARSARNAKFLHRFLQLFEGRAAAFQQAFGGCLSCPFRAPFRGCQPHPATRPPSLLRRSCLRMLDIARRALLRTLSSSATARRYLFQFSSASASALASSASRSRGPVVGLRILHLRGLLRRAARWYRRRGLH